MLISDTTLLLGKNHTNIFVENDDKFTFLNAPYITLHHFSAIIYSNTPVTSNKPMTMNDKEEQIPFFPRESAISNNRPCYIEKVEKMCESVLFIVTLFLFISTQESLCSKHNSC